MEKIGPERGIHMGKGRVKQESGIRDTELRRENGRREWGKAQRGQM